MSAEGEEKNPWAGGEIAQHAVGPLENARIRFLHRIQNHEKALQGRSVSGEEEGQISFCRNLWKSADGVLSARFQIAQDGALDITLSDEEMSGMLLLNTLSVHIGDAYSPE